MAFPCPDLPGLPPQCDRYFLILRYTSFGLGQDVAALSRYTPIGKIYRKENYYKSIAEISCSKAIEKQMRRYGFICR
jgi:hypothetical protein